MQRNSLKIEEDDDPEAASDEANFNLNSPTSDLPRPDNSELEGSMNINSNATVSQYEFTDPTTYEISNGDIITQEIGEYSQQPPAFNSGLGNDANLNIYGEFVGTSIMMLLIPHVQTCTF